jgi:hypothetical protein
MLRITLVFTAKHLDEWLAGYFPISEMSDSFSKWKSLTLLTPGKLL